jgi:hypothetical protein
MTYPIAVICIAIGHHGHDGLRHPDLREHVQGVRRKDAAPDLTQDGHRRVHFFVSNLAHHRRASSAASWATNSTSTPRASARPPADAQAPDPRPRDAKIAVARFTRTLGTLLSSGVPILDAMEIVAKTAGNVIIEEGDHVGRARISEGKNMAEPLAE